MSRETLPSIRRALLDRGWYVIAGMIILLYYLIVRLNTTQAPLIASLAFLIGPMLRRSTRLGLTALIEFLHRTAFVLVMVIPVVAGIGLIVGAMSLTGAAHSMARVLVDMAGGNLYLLLLLGAFVSFITPPVCCAAYQAAALARSQPLKTGLLSSRLGVALYLIPFLYVLQPGMVLQGEITFMAVAVPILAAIVGIAFISWGAERFMPVVGDIPRWTGIVLMVRGGLIAWPGVVTRIIGAILIGLILVSLTVAQKWLQASGAR